MDALAMILAVVLSNNRDFVHFTSRLVVPCNASSVTIKPFSVEVCLDYWVHRLTYNTWHRMIYSS
jgi:hypothetical protein